MSSNEVNLHTLKKKDILGSAKICSLKRELQEISNLALNYAASNDRT